MEQHPVPQNVTTFQFRLIGDMTIKQFGYLAGGAIVAYICYKLPLPLFLNWPLAIFSALGGFGLAFVPIEERPMDVWVLSFFKSIYSPTQYVWQKRPQHTPARQTPVTPSVQSVPPVLPDAAPTTTPPRQPAAAAPTRRGDILQNIFLPASPARFAESRRAGGPTPPAAHFTPGVLTMSTPKKGMFDWIFDLLTPKPKTAHPVAMQTAMPPHAGQWSQMPGRTMDISAPPVVKPTAQTEKALADTEDKVKKLQAELEGKNAAQSRIVELQAQLTELMSEREKMNQELFKLRKQDGALQTEPGATTTMQMPHNPTIQIILPGRAVKVGLPRLTTFPNIVTGIVKDKDKNLLPGVLVTVKDKDGVPLRALKTNRLGQFAASTPLSNGTYLVEIEDPRLRYTFDRAQVTLNGTIVPALEVFAKSEKEITRAKLEKELFGNQIS